MICRLCLVNTNYNFHIIGEDNIREYIAKFLKLELFLNDPISNRICNTCWSQMVSFQNFATQIEKAQESLYRTLKAANKTEEAYGLIPIKEESQLDESSGDFFHNDKDLYRMHNNMVKDEFEAEPKSNLNPYEANNLSRITRQSKKLSFALDKKINKTKTENIPALKTIQKKKITPTKSRIKKRQESESYIKARRTTKAHDEIIRKHTNLSCDICSAQLKDFTELNVHFRVAHNRRGYAVCCNKKLNKRSLFVDHINVHNDPEYFKCKECGNILSDRACLQTHMLMFHKPEEEKKFHCDVCLKKFPKQYLLDQHSIKHLSPNEFKFPCSECGKKYPTKAKRNAHIKLVHTNIYDIMCEICAKIIKGKDNFKKHLEEHEGITQPHIKCEECGTLLKDKYNLRKHMIRQHPNDEQRCACNICGKIATSKNALQAHVKYVHEKSPTFKCTLCEKSFKKLVILKEHMATHTGDGLYTCPYCPTTFNSKCNMYAHRKKKHRREWEASKALMEQEKTGFQSKKEQ